MTLRFASHPSRAKKPALLALAASIAVTGCGAPEGEFPTLAKRDVETYYAEERDMAVREAPPSPPVSTALASRIDALLGQARGGQSDFAQALPLASRTANAARNSARGGELWAQATVAISALDVSRKDSTVALADLDQLYAETVTGGDGAKSAAAVDQARTQVYDIVQSQNRQISDLENIVSR